MKKIYALSVAACVLFILGAAYFYFISPLSKSGEKPFSVYVDTDDTIDSIYRQLTPHVRSFQLSGLKTLERHSHLADNLRQGRYVVDSKEGAFSLFRRLKNGQQTPLNLTIPTVRTTDRLAAELGRRLMVDSAEIMAALTSPEVCKQYGYDTATIISMFIPNTYQIYWNTTTERFLDRMQKESNNFWTPERQQKAKKAGLTPVEVITLASIIDEETANDAEKPMIAGMYINRLNLRTGEYSKGMPLQADPTIKFAWKKFELRRIYNSLLGIDSPYNTYRYAGLPPGPIRIPTVAGIDAVLDYTHHNYLYMCAKEDFSGTHNFAATYSEHLQNAAKYARALNERGVK